MSAAGTGLKSAFCMAVLSGLACADPGGGGTPVGAGSLGLACYPNGTCNVGLECFRGVCVPEDDVTGGDVTDTADTIGPADGDSNDATEAESLQELPVVDTAPNQTCGDGHCTGAETPATCPQDCAAPVNYFAVIVDDSRVFPTHRAVGSDPCATASSPLNAHGADIDAVGLFDGASLIAYLDVIDYTEGGLCPNKLNTMTDPDEAKGAPNATINENFLSLGGGWLIGEFAGVPEILPGDTLIVYEVGTQCGDDANCGSIDEGYEVFVAHDLDCVNQGGYPYGSCATKLSEDTKGQASIPVSGF